MFDFLNNLQLADNEKVSRSNNKEEKIKYPTNGAHLRVYNDGSVYPSKELVDQFNLEYKADSEATHSMDVVKSNGFDVFEGKDYYNYAQTGNPNMILISAVSKDKPKVDLFGSVRYNEDGTPKNSVLTQGSKTFGIELISMIQRVYGVTLFNEDKFVDLNLVIDHPMTLPNGIYYIPKKVNRGVDKGKVDTVRRENTSIYALVIMEKHLMSKTEDIQNDALEAQFEVEGKQ